MALVLFLLLLCSCIRLAVTFDRHDVNKHNLVAASGQPWLGILNVALTKFHDKILKDHRLNYVMGSISSIDMRNVILTRLFVLGIENVADA